MRKIEVKELKGTAQTSFRFTKAFKVALQHTADAESERTGRYISANALLVRAALKGNKQLRDTFKVYAQVAEEEQL